MRKTIALLVVLLMVLGPFTQAMGSAIVDEGRPVRTVPGEGIPVVRSKASELISSIGGAFTENLGQLSEGAGSYYCQGSPLSVALGPGWVSYLHADAGGGGVMVRIDFMDADRVAPEGQEPLKHPTNYLKGNDPEGWVVGAASYREVAYEGLWEGVDLVYRLTGDALKYDLMVGPGADLSAVAFRYSGISGLRVDGATGDLVISTPVVDLVDSAPVTYQAGRVLPSRFVLVDDRTVTFEVDGRDPSLPMVIDPGLTFSTFIGGNNYEGGTLVTDDAGDTYVAGFTGSTDFPTTPGVISGADLYDQDGYVLKLRSDGSELLFSTYFGSSDYDGLMSLTLDGDGNIIVAGQTFGDDLPTTPGAYRTGASHNGDAFFAKLDQNGSSVVWCTLFGGNSVEGGTFIDLASNGDVMVAGFTRSGDMPTSPGCIDPSYNGGSDLFVARLSSNASSLLASTFFGGSADDEIEEKEVVLGLNDSVHIAGRTASVDLLTTPDAISSQLQGCHDAVLVVMDGNLTDLVYSSYFGGSDHDEASAIALDVHGSAYIVGTTYSDDLPVTVGAWDDTLAATDYWDAFLARIDPDGTIGYCTFFGESMDDIGADIGIGPDGLVYFTLGTTSTNLATSVNSYDSSHNGAFDIYLGVFDGDNQTVRYGAYIGGTKREGIMSYLDLRGGNVTIVVQDESDDFPTTPGAFETTFQGVRDLAVCRLVVDPMDPAPPGAPLNLSARLGDEGVELQWESPRNIGSLNLWGYRVYRGTSVDDLVPVGQMGLATTAFDEVPPQLGETYTYVVTAFSPWQEGAKSNTATILYMELPDPPVGIVAEPMDGAVQLNWSAPAFTGGVPLMGYHVLRGPDQSHMGRLATMDDASVLGLLDETVVNGVTYCYALVSFNARGNSTRSEVVTATPLGIPTAPRDLTATSGDRMVTLHWYTPEADGGTPIMSYWLMRGLDAGSMDRFKVLEPSSTSYLDSGLINGVEYFYALFAFNAQGDGPLSAVISVVPMGLPSSPLDLSATPGDGRVDLTWEPPDIVSGSAIETYIVLRGTSMGRMTPWANVSGQVTFFTDTGLENGVTLYYAVIAVNGAGEGPGTEAVAVTPRGLPGPPRALQVEAVAENIVLSWNAPASDGGSSVLWYVVYWGTSPDSLAHLATVSFTPMKYTDEGVEPGTVYYYAVAAITAAGTGPMGAIASCLAPTAPSVPVDLVLDGSTGSVVLKWGPPVGNGGSPVLAYRVYRGSTPTAMAFLTEVTVGTEHVDDTVVPGRTYHYAVSAVNTIGEGPRTEAMDVNPAVPITPPGPPQGLRVTETDGAVSLAWEPPAYDGGSSVTGYVIYRGTSPSSLLPVATVGSVLAYKDTDVSPGGTYYYFCVAAVNQAGTGEPSNVVEAKVPQRSEFLGLGPATWVVIAVAAVLLVIAGLAHAVESFKYGLMLLLLPLYSRFQHDQVLDNKNRYAIHGLIIDNPGIHFNGIIQEFDLALGVATYHLDVLEREHYIQSVRDGRLKRFYSTDAKIPNGSMRKTPEEVRGILIDLVRERPGISQKELIRELGLDRETVGYHVRALVKEDQIRALKKGRYTIYEYRDQN